MVVSGDAKQFLARLDQIAQLLRSPDVPGQVHHAESLAISIAQGAPSGAIAELALQVVTALGSIDRFPEAPDYMVTLDTGLRRLREALAAEERNTGE